MTRQWRGVFVVLDPAALVKLRRQSKLRDNFDTGMTHVYQGETRQPLPT